MWNSAIDREETQPDEMAVAMAELTEFVQVIVNRIQGQRSGARKRKVISPEAIEIIQRELAGGATILEVCDKLKKEGHKTEKGDSISYRVVSRYRNRVLTKLPPLPSSAVNHTFAKFVGKHMPHKKGGRVEISA